MKIVGPEPLAKSDVSDVHTIDLWYSAKDRYWIAQRLNSTGDPVGTIHRCRTRGEAMACLDDWLRRHPETHLTGPHQQAPSPRARQKQASKTPSLS